jgi:anti-sigma factor RsiW
MFAGISGTFAIRIPSWGGECMMTPRREIKQIELLSAYLDDQLSAKARVELENRLATDENLQVKLEELRITRNVMRSLPPIKAPRNFALTAEMVGIRRRTSRASMVMAFASVAASFLLVLTIAGDVLFSVGLPAAMRSAAEPPMFFQEAEAPVEEAPAALDVAEAPMAVESLPEAEVEKSVDAFADVGDDESAERAAAPEENEALEGVGETGAAEPDAPAELEAPAPTETQATVADQIIVEATSTIAPTPIPVDILQPTDLPEPPEEVRVEPAQTETQSRFPTVRIIEAGLAGIALITGSIALILRRKGSS